MCKRIAAEKRFSNEVNDVANYLVSTKTAIDILEISEAEFVSILDRNELTAYMIDNVTFYSKTAIAVMFNKRARGANILRLNK